MDGGGVRLTLAVRHAEPRLVCQDGTVQVFSAPSRVLTARETMVCFVTVKAVRTVSAGSQPDVGGNSEDTEVFDCLPGNHMPVCRCRAIRVGEAEKTSRQPE